MTTNLRHVVVLRKDGSDCRSTAAIRGDAGTLTEAFR
jgi:hypothetical protein